MRWRNFQPSRNKIGIAFSNFKEWAASVDSSPAHRRSQPMPEASAPIVPHLAAKHSSAYRHRPKCICEGSHCAKESRLTIASPRPVQSASTRCCRRVPLRHGITIAQPCNCLTGATCGQFAGLDHSFVGSCRFHQGRKCGLLGLGTTAGGYKQVRCQQEMQLKELELQERQLEMQRQALWLEQKAAQAEVQKQICLNNGLTWIQTNYGSYCAGETTSKVAIAPSPVAMPSVTTAETPAQACRNRGFNWYGYCADNKNTGEQK